MIAIRKTAYLTAFFKTVYQTSHKLNIFVTLCAYIFLGNSLSPEKVNPLIKPKTLKPIFQLNYQWRIKKFLTSK